jgi:hypothetical protein
MGRHHRQSSVLSIGRCREQDSLLPVVPRRRQFPSARAIPLFSSRSARRNVAPLASPAGSSMRVQQTHFLAMPVRVGRRRIGGEHAFIVGAMAPDRVHDHRPLARHGDRRLAITAAFGQRLTPVLSLNLAPGNASSAPMPSRTTIAHRGRQPSRCVPEHRSKRRAAMSIRNRPHAI